MKFVVLSLGLITLAACDSSNSSPPTNQPTTKPPVQISTPTPTSTPAPSATPVTTATPSPTATPTPTPVSRHLSVVIHQSTDFDSTALAKLEKARLLLEMVVNSEEFKQKVIHFTYRGTETYVQNNSFTNTQIYDLIQNGAELYPSKTQPNQTIDLWLQLYTAISSNTIGYTNPSYKTIYMNTRYYSSATSAEIAGNMIHEWLHKLGFDHDSASTARRPYSVPYAIGYLTRDLAKKLQ